MNASRAREYFSAFHEGSLDAGLRQQFQKALASDPKLQEEFADFAIAYEAMNFQADEVIEVPMNLSDKIANRLEAAQNAKPRVGFVWQGWFRNLALGGIAAAGGLIQRRMGLPDASVLVFQSLIFLVLLISETLYGRFAFFRPRGAGR
jgi:anti-sigma factor RsiW